VRTYIPEPDRGRRKWEGKAVEQKRTYENRRRVRGDRGRHLQKKRSELTERSFAHLYETGGMRRLHLRGRDNILKRLLVHAAAFNLSLILRKQLGRGKPRQFQGLSREFFAFYFLILAEFSRAMAKSETASAALPSKPTIPLRTFERSLPDSRRTCRPAVIQNSYYCHGLLVLLCYKRSVQQRGQCGSWVRRKRATLIRRVAIEVGLWRSARTRRPARLEVGRKLRGA
jgi:Transposase DDE domain